MGQKKGGMGQKKKDSVKKAYGGMGQKKKARLKRLTVVWSRRSTAGQLTRSI
jgi:hypothetical protein